MGGATRSDVWKLLGLIEGDLRRAQARFTEVRSMIADGATGRGPADRHVCPVETCALPFKGESSLASHLRNVHGID